MATLTLTNKTAEMLDADTLVTSYDVEGTVQLAGDSIWGDTAGRAVNVTGISITQERDDEDFYTVINVTHDSTWDIYTDTAFEAAVSTALGFDVAFTEQGMQEDGNASLETV